MAGIYIPNVHIPQYGCRISILSDGYAYYENMIEPYQNLGKVIIVNNHGRLIDADALLDAWDDNHTIPNAAAKVIEKTIIPADKVEG